MALPPADLRQPSPSQVVYREDCTQCFDSIDDEFGLNVCLSCFNGGCAGPRDHGRLHFKRFGHPLALNIKRTRKKIQRDEPPQKISRIAIAAETEEDRYDMSTNIICYSCGNDDIDLSTGNLSVVVESVMKAATFSKREEVKAWEQEFIPCEHTLYLDQQDSMGIESRELNQCSMCNLKENLWLCLECGNLGCGRSQFGGIGGNSHALAHSDSTSHGVAVKLGSITADGSADIYCYKCNEERTDPNIAAHLAHWGIHLADRQKTEKSLMEMQVEQNLKWDFSMTAEDGHELTPVFGAGFTGLKNLGNSCYLSSVVQCLFDLPEFRMRYYHPDEEPPFSETPAADLETQLRKLADGLISGRYSQPEGDNISSDSSGVPYQKGLAPAMFKYLVGRDHPEFSTMRQQDSFEFLLHVFKLISLVKNPSGTSNPIESFRFSVEQRLQCLQCKKVRYKVDEQDNISIPVPARRMNTPDQFETVTFFDCMDAFTGHEIVDFSCPGCGSKEGFTKRSSFRTLPQELVVNARRFELVNWVPRKLDIPLEVNDEPIDLSRYMSCGPIEAEELLPEVEETSDGGFKPDPEVLNQLLGMGFPKVRCEKAIFLTGNADAETAMNWLLSHLDDPDIDEPFTASLNKQEPSIPHLDPVKLAQLAEMGIDQARSRRALVATDGDVSRAIDWVFSHPDEPGDNGIDQPLKSTPAKDPGLDTTPAKYQLRSIICHKGSSVHAGHYVAFVRKTLPGKSGLSWVMFNDEKVVEVDDIHEMRKFAYLYFFSRV